MTTTAMSSARSNNGCWTCRVRKKKCDENRPNCSTCASLTLECFGYGARPVWMDNGILQKEQALKIKRIVGQNNHRRRKSRILNSTCLPFPGMTVLDKKSLGATSAPSLDQDNTSVEAPATATGFDGIAPADWSQLDSWSTNLDISNIVPEGYPASTDFKFDQLGLENSMLIGDGSFDGHDLVFSDTSQISQYSESMFSPSINTFTEQTYGDMFDAITQKETHRSGATSVETSSSENPQRRHPPSADGAIAKSPTSLANPILEDSGPQNEIEDHLFMHYLDEVFQIQFPFFHIPKKRSRGWLFSTIRRTKSVFYATLALSQCISRPMAYTSRSPRLSSNRNYHELAFKEFEIIKGEIRKSKKLPCITLILQLLFYEFFNGGTENWQDQLRVANSLIHPLLQTLPLPTGGTSKDADIVAQQQQREHHEMVVETIDNTEVQVVLGSFIWFDVIASASTRSARSLNLDHQLLLKTFGVKLESLFGCSNQILELISDVVCLDSWKKEAEKTRQLSMVELVKRGAKIEEDIHKKLEGLGTIGSLESDSSKHLSSIMSASQTEISRIFALSAQTYLHVVISGAHPELPEIADSVSQTIDAFKSLSDPQLLRHLVWPFCVTGCLATKVQQTSFYELVSKAGVTSSTVGTCWQAFEIIEDCWEVRKNCSYNCDWVFVMNKRSCNVLLA